MTLYPPIATARGVGSLRVVKADHRLGSGLRQAIVPSLAMPARAEVSPGLVELRLSSETGCAAAVWFELAYGPRRVAAPSCRRSRNDDAVVASGLSCRANGLIGPHAGRAAACTNVTGVRVFSQDRAKEDAMRHEIGDSHPSVCVRLVDVYGRVLRLAFEMTRACRHPFGTATE